MTREQIIMALARAYFRACWPGRDWKDEPPSIRAEYRKIARRQLKALEDAELRIVPVGDVP